MYSQPKRIFICTVIYLLLLAGAWFIYKPRIEADLTKRGNELLQTDAAFAGLGVSFSDSGRTGIITGKAADRDTARRAELMMERSMNSWSNAGGIHSVTVDLDTLETGGAINSAGYRLFLTSDRTVVSGEIGSKEARDALLKEVETAFPGRAIEPTELKTVENFGNADSSLPTLRVLPEITKDTVVSAVQWKEGRMMVELLAKDAMDLNSSPKTISEAAAAKGLPVSVTGRLIGPSRLPKVLVTMGEDKSITATGRAGSPADRKSLEQKIRAVFPATQVTCTLPDDPALSPSATPVEWLDGIAKLNTPGTQLTSVLFDAGVVTVSATAPDDLAKTALVGLVAGTFGDKSKADIIIKALPAASWFIGFNPDKSINLAGTVPDKVSQDAFIQYVSSKFPGWKVDSNSLQITAAATSPTSTFPLIDGLPTLIAAGGTLTSARSANGKMMLSGTVPDAAAKTKIDALVATTWKSQAIANFTTLTGDTQASPTPNAGAFSIAYSPGKLATSGKFDSEKTKKVIMDKLKAAYPRYTIADTSTVGAGGTPLSPWNSYLDRLAMVAIGSQATRASVQNGKMELSYTVNSEIAKTSLGERIKRLFGDRALARIEVVATPNAVDDPEAVFSDCIIFFDNGQKEFLGKEAGKLERVLTSMKTNPSIKLRVEGHTDNVGASAGNQLLSDNRASEVVKFLIEKGIAADRVQGKGFGAGRPADENKTDAGKAANRRVEFRIQ